MNIIDYKILINESTIRTISYLVLFIAITDLIAFVDGSYSTEKNLAGSGVVILDKNSVLLKKAILHDDASDDALAMRNVYGEIKAAEYAATYATALMKSITIFHENGTCGCRKSALQCVKTVLFNKFFGTKTQRNRRPATKDSKRSIPTSSCAHHNSDL